MITGLRGCTDCKTVSVLAPEFTIEPRWYYNITNRGTKEKVIKNNSANFVTLSFRYYPDWFVISNSPNISIQNQITIIPKSFFTTANTPMARLNWVRQPIPPPQITTRIIRFRTTAPHLIQAPSRFCTVIIKVFYK